MSTPSTAEEQVTQLKAQLASLQARAELSERRVVALAAIERDTEVAKSLVDANKKLAAATDALKAIAVSTNNYLAIKALKELGVTG